MGISGGGGWVESIKSPSVPVYQFIIILQFPDRRKIKITRSGYELRRLMKASNIVKYFV